MQRFLATAVLIGIALLAYLIWSGYFDDIDWIGILDAGKPHR